MLIIHGTVHTMDGPAIDNGFVAIREGKIWKVGPMEECPADWKGETLDARGGHILPGFVDAHCHLGMFGDAMGFEGDDGNEATDPCTPHLRAIDGVNPMDRCFRDARLAGVTTVLTGPGSANPISGQFVAMKTAGRWLDDMVIKAPAAMKLALGENPKLTYHERHEGPITRMATAAVIRENLAKAEEYREKLEAKVQELLEDTQIEESRIAAEVVIFADKICTDEELVRLRSHIVHMKETLESSDSGIGRKLDFIAQEMNREANTILSKANDLEVSNVGIDLKTEIEKVREQIQNIE